MYLGELEGSRGGVRSLGLGKLERLGGGGGGGVDLLRGGRDRVGEELDQLRVVELFNVDGQNDTLVDIHVLQTGVP